MSSDAEAEDVVSEAFMKAARSFDSFDSKRAKFSTWVVTIARNCMISHFRKARPSVALDDVSEAAFAVQGEQASVDDRDLVLRLLAALDEEERELVLMKYHEGMRNVDVANAMNMNASTVSTKLASAMRKMRKAAEKDA